MANRVRLVDIAERLNITKVSVSKALRDHPDISRETRELVKKTAAAMGYSPNLLARSLSSRKTHTLGVVVPKIAHTFFASVIDAIQEEATAKGYGIVLAVSNERADLERQHIERLLAMRVDGLLVSVSQEAPDLEVYEMVQAMRVPLVFFDRRIDSLPFASVTVDDRGGARRGVEHLIQAGFTEIAHIAGSLDTEIGRARLRGYQDAMDAHGIPIRDSWVIGGGFDEHHGYRAARQLFADQQDVPEVLFAVTFPVGLGARAALKEIDWELPGRVQIVSFGVGGFDETFLHPHVCVRQPTQKMGAEAVRLLLDEVDAIDDSEDAPEPAHRVLETTLILPTDGHGLGGDGKGQTATGLGSHSVKQLDGSAASAADMAERLCRDTAIDARSADPPERSCFDLPEKVLQFGTGRFLRGFSDAFVDQANRKGAFDGRIVVVGSTGSGRVGRINEQDGLYTLCVQGIDNGETVDRCTVVASVSRAIDSGENWAGVLDFVRSPDLEFVFSNTTEVGIRLDADDRPDLDPPRSFPGKLTAVLHERAEAFDYDPERGLTILCCELIEDNAHKLRSIVLELADRWKLGNAFADWVRAHNCFCNTLVDRIVPGRPDAASIRKFEQRLGYRDELLIQAEPYRLWAIEGDADLRERLGFADAEEGILVTPDISPYRTRKVRILNGTHTIMVPLSFLCGNDTIAESMEDALTSEFVRHVMLQEVVPFLDTPEGEAEMFAVQVLDRFANPFFHHKLMSIAPQQTSKMDVRVVPSLLAYHAKTGRLPEGIALGFAAYLLFVSHGGRAAEVELPADECGGTIRSHRKVAGPDDVDTFVRAVCADRNLWHVPLDALPGFVECVSARMRQMQQGGARETLEDFLSQTNVWSE